MRPNLPGLPPPYLHTASEQILEVGTVWETSLPPTFSQIFLLTSLPPSSSPPLSLHPSLLLPPPTGPWRIVRVHCCRLHVNKPLDAPEEVPGVDAVEGRESLKWSLTGWVLTAGQGMGYTCGLIVQ